MRVHAYAAPASSSKRRMARPSTYLYSFAGKRVRRVGIECVQQALYSGVKVQQRRIRETEVHLYHTFRGGGLCPRCSFTSFYSSVVQHPTQNRLKPFSIMAAEGLRDPHIPYSVRSCLRCVRKLGSRFACRGCVTLLRYRKPLRKVLAAFPLFRHWPQPQLLLRFEYFSTF